jgi:hypothetical protein
VPRAAFGRGDLRTQDGRAGVERYFAEFCADELRGPPKILHAPGHSFSDVARKVVSIINVDSLAALADVVRAPVDPLRFRANVYVAGWPVWSELDSAQRTMRLTTLSRVQGPTPKPCREVEPLMAGWAATSSGCGERCNRGWRSRYGIGTVRARCATFLSMPAAAMAFG